MLNHFWATAWFDKLYEAALFEEYVLWFDACVTKIPIGAPRPPHVFLGSSPDFDQGREFSAFAARHPKKAVERMMPDGKVHGAFTYALLKGLNGDAADSATGLVTSSGLKKHLINTMKTWMSDADREDADVSDEPGFGFVDELVFAQVDPPKRAVQFRFSQDAEGSGVSIRTSAFDTVVNGVVENGVWQTKLRNGIFSVSVEATGDTKLFEIRSDENVVIEVP